MTAEVDGTDFQSKGMTHTLEVTPNNTGNGWVIFASSFMGTGSANITQDDAVKLAQMLLAGPAGDSGAAT